MTNRVKFFNTFIILPTLMYGFFDLLNWNIFSGFVYCMCIGYLFFIQRDLFISSLFIDYKNIKNILLFSFKYDIDLINHKVKNISPEENKIAMNIINKLAVSSEQLHDFKINNSKFRISKKMISCHSNIIDCNLINLLMDQNMSNIAKWEFVLFANIRIAMKTNNKVSELSFEEYFEDKIKLHKELSKYSNNSNI